MAKAMKKTQAVPKKAETVEELPLEGSIATQLALANERLTTAQTLIQLRQTELQVVLDRTRQFYEEGGKYAVTEIDFSKGTVRRTPNFRSQSEAAKDGSGESPKG